VRPITFHAINPANEAIKLIAADGPGPGGASHQYYTAVRMSDKQPDQIAYEAYCEQTGWKSLVSGSDLPQWENLFPPIRAAWKTAALAVVRDCTLNPMLSFQDGPVKENGEGVNGITHEVLLAILIDRLMGFQSGQYANDYNAKALTHLQVALDALHQRTRDREARGVEGTHKV
jgi:hypothetical protein